MQCAYLALGDSYTIGEAVLLTESFPYQAIQLLRQQLAADIFYAPEIIAKTGWTTDELYAAIQPIAFLEKYAAVSLLIGVNDQYRGRSVADFEAGFLQLIREAIRFAGNIPSNVYVLSIPDWGLTPFAEGRDKDKIRIEIDAFNEVCKRISENFKTNFIDVTTTQRLNASSLDFIAADRLHPSAKEYAEWANKLKDAVLANASFRQSGT